MKAKIINLKNSPNASLEAFINNNEILFYTVNLRIEKQIKYLGNYLELDTALGVFYQISYYPPAIMNRGAKVIHINQVYKKIG